MVFAHIYRIRVLLRKMGLEGLDHRETRIERGFQHISHVA